jgi:hypothetical protein
MNGAVARPARGLNRAAAAWNPNPFRTEDLRTERVRGFA